MLFPDIIPNIVVSAFDIVYLDITETTTLKLTAFNVNGIGHC